MHIRSLSRSPFTFRRVIRNARQRTRTSRSFYQTIWDEKFPVLPHTLVLAGGRKIQLDQFAASGGREHCRIYMARFADQPNEKPFALKLYRSPQLSWKAKNEARVIALHHENVLDILEGGFTEFHGIPLPYVLMEWFPGTPLSAIITSGQRNQNNPHIPDPVDLDYLQLVRQVLIAFEYLHAHGIAHGDRLKARNILVLFQKGIQQVKLADFNYSSKPWGRRWHYHLDMENLGHELDFFPDSHQVPRLTAPERVWQLLKALKEKKIRDPKSALQFLGF